MSFVLNYLNFKFQLFKPYILRDFIMVNLIIRKDKTITR